uniref:Uncharacterized protein n=1 Tax=Setaria italica TaxID=4555 RepID=K3ZKR8_SETIT
MVVSPPVIRLQYKEGPSHVLRPDLCQQSPHTSNSQLLGDISQPFKQCLLDISPLAPGSNFLNKNEIPKLAVGYLK